MQKRGRFSDFDDLEIYVKVILKLHFPLKWNNATTLPANAVLRHEIRHFPCNENTCLKFVYIAYYQMHATPPQIIYKYDQFLKLIRIPNISTRLKVLQRKTVQKSYN